MIAYAPSRRILIAFTAAGWLSFSVVITGLGAAPTPDRVLTALGVGLLLALATVNPRARWVIDGDALSGPKRARLALAQSTDASVSCDRDGHAFLRIEGRGDEVQIPVSWLPLRIGDFLHDVGLDSVHPWTWCGAVARQRRRADRDAHIRAGARERVVAITATELVSPPAGFALS